MKRAVLILALILVAFAAWAGWTCSTTEGKVRDIASRLPSEEGLNAMPAEQTVEQLKLAIIQVRPGGEPSGEPFGPASQGRRNQIAGRALRADQVAPGLAGGALSPSAPGAPGGTVSSYSVLPCNFLVLRPAILLISLPSKTEKT